MNLKAVAFASLFFLGACSSALTTNKGQEPPKVSGELPKPDIRPVVHWKSADAFENFCRRSLERATTLRSTIATHKSGARTLENTLEVFNRLFAELDASQGLSQLMRSVHPRKDVRGAAEKCEKTLSKFENDIKLDSALHSAVQSVDPAKLDSQAVRFRKLLLRTYRRAGVDKDDKTRNRLRTLHEEMVKVGQAFQKNVQNDVRRIPLDSAKDLAGMPADFIAAHKPNAAGKIEVTTDYPDFYPIQTYAEDESLRRRLYQAFLSRGYPQNTALIRKLIELRHEYAGLLGFSSWAAYMADDKMVKSATAINRFIADLTQIVRPRSDSDIKVLLARKKKDNKKAKRIRVWDRFFYVGKVRAERHKFDARVVREYLPFNRVRDGILDLYGELFGLEFERASEMPVWDKKVEAYRVSRGKKTLGYFYLDMHSRAGKYKHAAVFPIRTGFIGGPTPIASMVCNFPETRGAKQPGLMEHSDVVTFFHEFGHLIHHLLSTGTPWVTMAGFHVEWDFVEAPSQLLEEWAWDPAVLARFARHYKTNEPVQADLVKRMRAADEFGKGVHVMRQLFYTAYSFFIHYRDPKKLDLDAYTGEMYQSYSPYPSVKGGHVYANFGHLVGYSSMYYTYQWSLVIAKDLFTRFRTAGLLSPGVAEAYRKSILEPGGTKDASDLVKDFLGRPYRLDAYKRWLQAE
jgi:thimet oligopeptidase